MNYIVENGKIFSPKGLPCLPRWFCDDRIAVQNDMYGIVEIQYFNAHTLGSEKVFFKICGEV